MATNAAVISDIKSSYKWESADTYISDRAILSRLYDDLYTLIKQQTDKRKLWGSPNIFTPLKIQLEEVAMADFCEFQSDCTVARSKHKLPKIAEGIFGLLTQGVFSIDKKKRFVELDPQRYANILQLDLPQRDVYYWFFNNYLYITDPLLETVILQAFLETMAVPREFSLDCDDEQNSCPVNPMDMEFRCPGYLKGIVTDMTSTFLSKYYKRSVADNTSDDKDDSK